jgi:hypothetical protein
VLAEAQRLGHMSVYCTSVHDSPSVGEARIAVRAGDDLLGRAQRLQQATTSLVPTFGPLPVQISRGARPTAPCGWARPGLAWLSWSRAGDAARPAVGGLTTLAYASRTGSSRSRPEGRPSPRKKPEVAVAPTTASVARMTAAAV